MLVGSSSSRRAWDGVKELEGGIIILASCEYPFIRLHENLVRHLSNNKYIYLCLGLCIAAKFGGNANDKSYFNAGTHTETSYQRFITI